MGEFDMKIKKNFIKVAAVGDNFVVVPVGEESEKMHRVIELNGTAAQIYDGIAKGLDESGIAAELAAEYGITAEKAAQDVKLVVEKLAAAGVVE